MATLEEVDGACLKGHGYSIQDKKKLKSNHQDFDYWPLNRGSTVLNYLRMFAYFAVNNSLFSFNTVSNSPTIAVMSAPVSTCPMMSGS